MTRIAVVGVGAIGGAVAADLADLRRHELTLCVRTGFDRLVVEHPSGRSEVDAAVITRPGQAARVDWVLLATKAHQTADAGAWLDALCGPETRVAVLQNGVDHIERVRPSLDPSVDVVPVVVQLPAERTAPGRVVQGHPGLLIVPDDEAGRAFADLFEHARTAVKPSADFVTQLWWKLVSNAALGGVCALTLRELGRGIEIPTAAAASAVARLEGGAPDGTSSMQRDLMAGRPSELEVQNGAVVRMGLEAGIATPVNAFIYHSLMPQEMKARGNVQSNEA